MAICGQKTNFLAMIVVSHKSEGLLRRGHLPGAMLSVRAIHSTNGRRTAGKGTSFYDVLRPERNVNLGQALKRPAKRIRVVSRVYLSSTPMPPPLLFLPDSPPPPPPAQSPYAENSEVKSKRSIFRILIVYSKFQRCLNESVSITARMFWLY